MAHAIRYGIHKQIVARKSEPSNTGKQTLKRKSKHVDIIVLAHSVGGGGGGEEAAHPITYNFCVVAILPMCLI